MSKLKDILAQAAVDSDRTFGLDETMQNHIGVVLENACSGRQKSVLAVLLTLLHKKNMDPNQDIRLHKAGLKDGIKKGFSGRGLDEREVTPFLAEENFPNMKGGTGWLTRSLEQHSPYSLNYGGKVKPAKLKDSFLKIVDQIENGADPLNCMKFILGSLHDWRSENAKMQIAKPLGKGIAEIVNLIEDHWDLGNGGSAKLPVLAVYAAYKCLTSEVRRYRNCKLLPLHSHTAADSRTGRVGDIQINGENGFPMEAVEIKHSLPITARLVTESVEKIISSGAKTYYILSTNESISCEEMKKITQRTLSARQQYGCQIIVNGVATTLKYYLRLLADTDQFVREYIELMEFDDEITYEVTRSWNVLTKENLESRPPSRN